MSLLYIVDFIQSSNYFISKSSPERLRRWPKFGLPSQIAEKYFAESSGGNPISVDICFSTWENDWFHVYRRKKQGDEVNFWEISNPNNYPKLNDWLSKLPNGNLNQQSLYVSLGPNGSFFARCNLGYRWHDLPDSAEMVLQSFLGGEKWEKKAKQFLFGQSDCFIILDGLGKVYYDNTKRDVYPLLFDELDRIMKEEGAIKFLSFRASPPGDYFLEYSIDDTCVLPYSEDWETQKQLIDLKRKLQS